MKGSIFLFVILALCLVQSVFAQEPSILAVESRGYLLGPGDEIVVKVLSEEQFNFEATVNENGNIEVPFFDKPLMAMCKSERELRTEVAKVLSKYLRTPQVTVRVKERKSRQPAIVYGEVKKPSEVILMRKARLRELLSFAGGVTENAGGTVEVLRLSPPLCADAIEEQEWKAEINGLDVPTRTYSLTGMREGKGESNPVIYPGDIIEVKTAPPVYIMGEVKSAQGVLLKEGGLTLSQLIAMVGGVNREAKTKNIKIYRLKPDSKDREVIATNYDLIKKGEQKDIMLEPYDIIEVDKAKKSIGQTILEIVTNAGKTAVGGLSGGLTQRILY